jgi:hypothetical protein
LERSGGRAVASEMIDSVVCLRRSISLTGSGSRARRLSLGAAITFAVSAVAGVAGGRLTRHITPALGVFVGLVVVGMLLSYWLDRSMRDSGSDHHGPLNAATAARAKTDLCGVRQNIIASGPGAIAQGAIGGNVINHEGLEQPDPGASTPLRPSEEREG